MRNLFLALLSITLCAAVWGQSQNPQPPANSQKQDSSTGSWNPASANSEPPRSDRVNINELGNIEGKSSSKDTEIDLTPPPDDDKAHPKSDDAVSNAEAAPPEGDVAEFHPFDPHKAAKDIEVGDFYFKRKNYRAAEDRYREALYYKNNDALATYHLAICLDKQDRFDDAREQYEKYLKILPHGPEAENARKAIDRLNASSGPKAAK